ncbi:MAG TPA: NAD(+)/NADH kinase [Fimbriimonas sp.]
MDRLRIHLVVNGHRPDAIEAAAECAARLQANQAFVGVDSDSGRFLPLPVVDRSEFGRAEVIVAFGGDGTLIRAAHLASETGTPILGVYYGRFGFVTQCRGEDVACCLEEYLSGQAPIERRMMIRADMMRGGQSVAALHSLNEVVIQRSVTGRMMTFDIDVDGYQIASYPADGVIVCTPTGSTAYNLSAGGPLLEPMVQAFALTALAPHTLTARSLVLRPEAEIHLRVQSDGDSVLSVDGQTRLHLLSRDEVRVTRSERVTNLIVVERQDFLKKLGQRLFFSQSMYEDRP